MDIICTPGTQSFVKLRKNNYFYVDKTRFIKDWWNSGVDVTLITRPRRFGKTLMLDTVRTFFSPEFAETSTLFEGLEIWQEESFRTLHAAIPVIFVSFSEIKEKTYEEAIASIKEVLASIYRYFLKLLNGYIFSDWEKELFSLVHNEMSDLAAKRSLRNLSECLAYQYKTNPIILLDEYDTPLQEAWIHGYWDLLVNFMRGFFNSTFKTNPYLDRGLITGITRVSKESIFSDLNNLAVVTTTSDSYADCFGFTEEEVFRAMDRFGLTAKDVVKEWYDGFCFGKQKALYNPWSISNYLAKKEVDYYWADSSENALLGELLAHGDITIKEETAQLLRGESMTTPLDEQITFSQLYTKEGALWSLLLAVGYVKALAFDRLTRKYELSLTNRESQYIFENTISEWFIPVSNQKNKFIQALLTDDIDGMNEIMMDITENIFSTFDTQNRKNTSENFYHAFVLGLLVDLKDQYDIRSNRESGFGRYDICLFPKERHGRGVVIEFKVLQAKKDKTLTETCTNALMQIRKKEYVAELVQHNIPSSSIFVYGFAFHGKEVLICGGAYDTRDWASMCEKI